MPDTILRAFDAQVEDVKTKTRTVVARICTEDIDRFNSVFSVRGAKLDGYLKNGVVLWEHGKDTRRMRDPIGRNEWLKKEGGEAPREMIAKTRFLEDEFSSQRYEWYRDGILSGFSIGAIPDLELCGPATRDEIKANPALGRGYYTEFGGGPGVFMYRNWELTEYSGTTVPGNPNALTTERAAKLLACVERGLWIPDDVKADLMTRSAEAPPEPVSETPIVRTEPYVEEHEGIWSVFRADGQRCLSGLSEGIARDCLTLMMAEVPADSRTRYHAEAQKVLAETRRMYGEIRDEIKEYIDLYRYGRV